MGLEEARTAFARRDWPAAYEAFAAAEDLAPADLAAYAEAAHWIGRGAEVVDLYQTAHRAHLEAGEPRRAGYAAFMVSDEAVASAQRMQDLGRRFDDETLRALGVFFEGRARIKQAKVREGLALLDEAMAAALGDTLEPMWTGAIYCGLLDACHELVDLRRAQEWTVATRRWCEPLPVASLYPGICRVHSAEMLQQRGEWAEAEVEALGVCRDSGSTATSRATSSTASTSPRTRRPCGSTPTAAASPPTPSTGWPRSSTPSPASSARLPRIAPIDVAQRRSSEHFRSTWVSRGLAGRPRPS